MIIRPAQPDANYYAEDADRYYARFEGALSKMKNSELVDQVQIHQDLFADAELFKNLKESVQGAYNESLHSDSSLNAVVLQLTEVDHLLDQIEEYNDICIEILYLSAEVDEIFKQHQAGQHQPRVTKSLKKRVTEMAKKEGLNFGQSQEIQKLQTNLRQLTQNSHSSPITTTTQESSLQSDRQIQAETDENYLVGAGVDRWSTIKKEMTNDPVKNFEVLLKFYGETVEFFQERGICIPSNQKKVEEILNEMERCMRFAVKVQRKFQAAQTALDQTQQDDPPTLLKLQRAIGSACGESQSEHADLEAIRANVQSIFNELSEEEKDALFLAVSNKGSNPLPKNFRNLAFSHWGTYQTKLDALFTLPKPQNEPIIITKPKSEEMRERMVAAVKAAQKKPQISNNPPKATTKPSKNSSPINPPPTAKSSSRINSIVSQPSSYAGQTSRTFVRGPTPQTLLYSGTTVTGQPLTVTATSYRTKTNSTRGNAAQPSPSTEPMVSISKLEELLFLLRAQGTCGELQEACDKLFNMESKGSKLPFKISSDIPSIIAERPYYHLWLINQNECSIKVAVDTDYGRSAMNGTFLTSNWERRRAIQRTIIELGLEGLRYAKNKDDADFILNAFDRLEMDVMDLPDSYDSMIGLLGREMYKLQREAYEANSEVENPDDPKFNKRFGREAFCIFDPTKVLSKTKIYAIRNVREELKVAWNVS